MNWELSDVKLGFKVAEEPEIKLQTFAGSWRKQGNFKKRSASASLTTLKPLIVWITINWKILKEIGSPDHLTCLLRNLMQVKKQQLELDMEQVLENWVRSTIRLYIVTLLILLICIVHHAKCQVGGITSWNQDCQEKYQQPQICRWYHYMGESEEELKSLLKRLKWRVKKLGWNSTFKKLRSWHLSCPITSWLQNHCRWWL